MDQPRGAYLRIDRLLVDLDREAGFEFIESLGVLFHQQGLAGALVRDRQCSAPIRSGLVLRDKPRIDFDGRPEMLDRFVRLPEPEKCIADADAAVAKEALPLAVLGIAPRRLLGGIAENLI